MELKPGIVRTANLNAHVLRKEAKLAGYETFVLNGDDVVDKQSFFDAVRATLPLDPPVISSNNWDALSDSLWEGLYELPARRIVIIWPNARRMAHAVPSTFQNAMDVLKDVVDGLAGPKTTLGRPKEVTIVVESI